MNHSERGFTLLTTGASAAVLIGMLGLAVDIGRMYIVKNETQTYTDSAALAAVAALDGTLDGIHAAKTAVQNNTNRYNLGQTAFTGTAVEFAAAKEGPWFLPTFGTGIRFVRVTASAEVPLLFLPAVGSRSPARVSAVSVAAQAAKTSWKEGLFPFSPLAHDAYDAPHYGLVPGRIYTLRWASNPRVNVNTCPGDNSSGMIELAEAGGGEERGFIEENSSSVIRASIIYDYQTVFRTIGESVAMTGGAKRAQRDAIIERILQDSDTTGATFADYSGNGRRYVGAPINTGYPDYRIVQIGGFLLLNPGAYPDGGNQPFCALYVGPYVEGTKKPGGGGMSGGYVLRLIF